MLIPNVDSVCFPSGVTSLSEYGKMVWFKGQNKLIVSPTASPFVSASMYTYGPQSLSQSNFCASPLLRHGQPINDEPPYRILEELNTIILLRPLSEKPQSPALQKNVHVQCLADNSKFMIYIS